MREQLKLVTDWLLQASEQVGPEYFQLPVAGAEEPEYRERVYCYELYHRWRCHWDDDFPFSLGGEIDKSGHPLIRGAAKPDFLVHIPRHMTNLVIVEVKPSNASAAKMTADLKKLTSYRRDLRDQNGLAASYYAAYFWVYGVRVDQWPELRSRLLAEIGRSRDFDPELVSCFLHEQAGSRAIAVRWK